MESIVGKLIFIFFCILFVIGFFDSETKDSNESLNQIDKKAKKSNLKSDFLGKEHWDDIDEKLCDYPELDQTWKKQEALCYLVMRGYEETRIEVLSMSPPLVIYRGFFTEKQVKDYKRIFEKGTPKKQMVISANGTEYSSTFRVVSGVATPASYSSEAQSLHDTASRLIPAINFANAEDILGLKYNIKGHYAPHYDYLEVYDGEENAGFMEEDNRMATFMMVFQSAVVGGGTVFPYIGTVARTKPGDAILWFNMKQNMKMELLSLHGGCPVRSGEKIISTIWVESRGQELFKTFYEDKSFSADVLLR